MTLSMTHPAPSLTGNCCSCGGPFESCRCGARPQTGGGALPLLPFQSGTVDDIHDEDEATGLEPYDDLAALHQLVRRLVTDGDHRAQRADRRARRTLGEMVPGHTRQPLLTLHRPRMGDLCPLCDKDPCADGCPYGSAASGPVTIASAAGRVR
ncbi:hypothetical protein [Streptomyces sp. NPDC059247]|uniref:hypothetical protein n=1 Tax=Streptomyces sp. NPDC059247 TaxID=3346790 RepID=UPI003692BA0C